MFTLQSSSLYEYKIKGSIFISHIFKVSNLNIFKDKLSEMKVKYSDSTHICYGYRISGENTNLFNEPDIIEYYNDDGEPSGTLRIVANKTPIMLAGIHNYKRDDIR